MTGFLWSFPPIFNCLWCEQLVEHNASGMDRHSELRQIFSQHGISASLAKNHWYLFWISFVTKSFSFCCFCVWLLWFGFFFQLAAWGSLVEIVFLLLSGCRLRLRTRHLRCLSFHKFSKHQIADAKVPVFVRNFEKNFNSLWEQFFKSDNQIKWKSLFCLSKRKCGRAPVSRK